MKKIRFFKTTCVLLTVLLISVCAGCAEKSPSPSASSDGTTAQSTDEVTAQPADGTSAQPADEATAQSADGTTAQPSDGKSAQTAGKIYLYGEQHAQEKILNRENELWYEHYHTENMRHLFIELPYYTGELLNMWMQSDSDELLDEIFDDWEGTSAHNPYIKDFYQKIKKECPDTVFHGTDVGHQYMTTGNRYLDMLTKSGQKDSQQYKTARKNIEQGVHYYEKSDSVYRENCMSENFTREYDKLNGASIAGFYGSAHTDVDSLDLTGTVPSMANQLYNVYGDAIRTEDLTSLLKLTDPIRTDTVNINGRDYEASFFGEEDLTGFKDFKSRKFWRLENAYPDFKDNINTGDMLPYDNYPVQVETGQVFMIEYTKTDGSVTQSYYRAAGTLWQKKPTTESFAVKGKG